MPRSIEEVVLQVKRIELVVPWDIPNTNALFVCNQLLTRDQTNICPFFILFSISCF